MSDQPGFDEMMRRCRLVYDLTKPDDMPSWDQADERRRKLFWLGFCNLVNHPEWRLPSSLQAHEKAVRSIMTTGTT